MNLQTTAPFPVLLCTQQFAQRTFTSLERKSLPEPGTRKRLTISPYRLEDAKMYGNTSESQAASYDRDNPLYPYKSHGRYYSLLVNLLCHGMLIFLVKIGQWLKACYGLVACIILILFNGVSAFIEPFSIRKFVAAYISVSHDQQLNLFLVLTTCCLISCRCSYCSSLGTTFESMD